VNAPSSRLTPAEQAQWITELVNRTDPAPPEAPAACILDTGVNRGHPLLQHSLAEDDLHTCDPGWGSADHDGHGTEMAGVTLYGTFARRWRVLIASGCAITSSP